MQVARRDWCCGSSLRIKCFIIGYMNLIASIVDIGCHLLVVAIVTKGFQCDVDKDSLRLTDWPWLEPVLLVLNLGTHGFYPFPLILRSYSDPNIDYFPMPGQPRCYPGMLHVYLIDILNFLINAIWFRFVLSFVAAVHKKDPEPMRMFYGLSVLKLVLQMLYIAYQPDRDDFTVEGYWFIKLMDVCVATIFLFIIHKYIKQLMIERAQLIMDQPPSYVECLINGGKPQIEEKKEAIVTVEQGKDNTNVATT
ncbi:uncharacterized protein LOC123700860 [Colias croceus]|uniref:uncharacterized protein LOC123700860 n=1 Tax=Colias crocea TaxID=72248 RepID=UPI001E27F1B2|nr:uncharacterized protein LOC123700860 [Colias croceus]